MHFRTVTNTFSDIFVHCLLLPDAAESTLHSNARIKQTYSFILETYIAPLQDTTTQRRYVIARNVRAHYVRSSACTYLLCYSCLSMSLLLSLVAKQFSPEVRHIISEPCMTPIAKVELPAILRFERRFPAVRRLHQCVTVKPKSFPRSSLTRWYGFLQRQKCQFSVILSPNFFVFLTP